MKGQIRLTETIAILFIFFLLVALGISFYAKYSKVAFQEREEELLQNRAVKATLKASFIPNLAVSAVLTLALTEMLIPIYPDTAESSAPKKNPAAMGKPNKYPKMIVMITAKIAIVLYCRAM